MHQHFKRYLAVGWGSNWIKSWVTFKMEWWHSFKKCQILTFNIWFWNILEEAWPDKRFWVDFFNLKVHFLLLVCYPRNSGISKCLLLLAVGTLSCCISEISVIFVKMLVYRNQNFLSEIISIYRWEGIVFWNNASSLLMSNFNARRLLMNWNEFQWRKLNKGPSINYVTKKDWVSGLW